MTAIPDPQTALDPAHPEAATGQFPAGAPDAGPPGPPSGRPRSSDGPADEATGNLGSVGAVVQHGLLATGVFALAFAALLPLVVYPRVAVLPGDPAILQLQTTNDATALIPDLKSPAGARVVQHVPLTIGTYITQARRPHPDDSVVWQIATRISVRDNELLNARVEIASLNRRTTRSDNCCGDSLWTDLDQPFSKPLRHSGYLTFPFDTQKQTYPFWDVQLNGTRPAVYAGEDRRDGMKVYKFRAANDWSQVGTQELPGALFGVKDPSVTATGEYRDTRTYYVEPNTGATVDLQEQLQQRYRYQDRTVTAVSANLESPSLPEKKLKETQTGAVLLPWLRYRATPVLIVVALLCFAGAIGLARRRNRPGPVMVQRSRPVRAERARRPV